jgi:hypothetical protein
VITLKPITPIPCPAVLNDLNRMRAGLHLVLPVRLRPGDPQRLPDILPILSVLVLANAGEITS